MQDDTIKLLRECDAGAKMGIASIKEVQDKVKNGDFKNCLDACHRAHDRLGNEVQSRLKQLGDTGKEPNPMAKGMSWIKTNVMLTMDESDATIADLLTDGCNMGVKSLNRYLNQYPAAEEPARRLAAQLSALEEQLAVDLRPYL